ncbi:hypothetical protein [Vulcanisaeta distributa]|uniref:hypothetical protein n=1 Tax=Vulcanisaeta distributa TaxID=164451 RepID=UPI00069B11F4|nr:hypothetical protein [Vulcanisaeta distributa]
MYLRYISFYVLNIPDTWAKLLTVAIPIASSILVFTELSYWFLLGTAIIGIALSIPLNWRYSLVLTPTPLTNLFTGIFSSSLLLICITLTPYVDADPRDAKLVLYAFYASAILMIIGNLFKPPAIIYELQSIGIFSLIVVEYIAIYNLLTREVRVNRLIYAVPILATALAALSLVNYDLFYDYTIYLSLAALYVSLALGLVPVYAVSKPWGMLLAAIDVGLMALGEYSLLTQAGGIYVSAVVLSMLGPALTGLLAWLIRRLSNR